MTRRNAGGRTSLSSGTGHDNLPEAAKHNDGWYPGVCKMCMQGDCIQRVHVVDGVVVEIEGDKRAPNNKGTMCARGCAGIMNLYNPWRVRAPVKRTNPNKGLNEDPHWVEISWEEAFATVSEKLKAIRKENPRQLVIVTGFGNFPANQITNKAFARAYGTPNLFPTHGISCAYHFGPAYTQGIHPESVQDILRTEYTIVFGKGLGPTLASASTSSRTFIDAIERGTRIVVVDPRCSVEASKAAQWIPIRPGTDCAFLLAMLHSVLYEIGNFDVWFVKNRTNGPYLIGPDGYYVRDNTSGKPLLWDEVEGKARPFDEIPPVNAALEGSYTVNGASAKPGFQLIKESVADYTPEWAAEITTVPAETIRRAARELIDHAHIGETIDIDGVTMPFRPVGIQYQRGAYQHTINGSRGDLVARILCELVGAMDVPGGLNSMMFPRPEILKPDKDGTVSIALEAVPEPWEWPPKSLCQRMFYPVSHKLAHIGARAVMDPEEYHIDYAPQMILTYGGNPFHSLFDKDIWEQVYTRVPFSASICLVYDEAAIMSDILMPEHSFMERDFYEHSLHEFMAAQGLMNDDTHITRVFGRRDASAIKNPCNSRDGDEIVYELAERTGILTGSGGMLECLGLFNPPFDMSCLPLDINRRQSKQEVSEAWLKKLFHYPDKRLDDITDESGPYYDVTGSGKDHYSYSFWPENKTRHPMYMVHLKKVAGDLWRNMQEAGIDHLPGWEGQMDYWWKAWEPLPGWVPSRELTAPPEYDLNAINFKTVAAPFKLGEVMGNPFLYETFTRYDPYEYRILLNTKTAAEKGLKDGDRVTVESRYGSTQGILKTTELIHPLAVGIPGVHGSCGIQENPITGSGPFFNTLCSSRQEDGAVDPITGGFELGPAVKISRSSI